MSSSPDAVVVGAGPNGLAAAIVIAQAGRKVVLFEASESVGGGVRSAELTLPGFVHDVCSAVHPLAAGSPFFRTLPLASHGLEWIEPPAMLAHPLDDGSAVTIERSVTQTAANLVSDRPAYEEVIGSLVRRWPQIEMDVLGPLRWPRRPLMMAHFGWLALESAERFARRSFGHEPTQALWAGIAAHSVLPLDFFATAGFGLVLTVLAHTSGWLIPRGGAQRIANALAAYFESLGGTIVTHAEIKSVEDLPAAPATLFDLSPKPLLRIAGRRFPDWYRRKLEQYRYGMGVYKVDWALHAPIPWRASACARAGTVHLGGTIDEIAHSERQTFEGQVPDRPLIIVAQPTLFDPGRAPAGCHTAWTYCHVPHGCTVDMLSRLEDQIERFAPGFRDRVLARSITTPADLERNNPNMVGGDIASGANDIRQLFARPTWRRYSTPVRGWYICSASTPPGGGVHGMCGYFAAHRALAEVLRE